MGRFQSIIRCKAAYQVLRRFVYSETINVFDRGSKAGGLHIPNPNAKCGAEAVTA